MTSSRSPSWLPFVGVLAAVAGGLGWLLLGFGSSRTGAAPWAESATAGPTLAFYVEPDIGHLTPDQVARLPAAAWRRWTSLDYFSGGFHTRLWARVTLRNDTAQPQAGVLADSDYFADRVEAWARDPGGETWTHLVSGEAVVARDKALRGREVAFPLSVPAHAERVVYLRGDDYYLPYFRLEWWPEATDYHTARQQRTLGELAYFGGLFALLGYNVLLWSRLRLKDIGYYVCYLGATALFMVLARALPLELDWRLGSPGLEAALTIALALSGFFLTGFARAFLALEAHLPRGQRLARGLGWGMLGIAAIALCLPSLSTPLWMTAAVAGSGLTHLSLLGLAIAAWCAGARQARFFVASFGCLFAGSLPLVAVWFFKINFKGAALMGLMIGSALEMLLLSLAVADRFAQAQRERAAAQEKLLEEAEQRRLVEAAYADELEVEVGERTRELEAANTDKDRMLIALGHDLRSPLAALTQRAEQLRGGSAVPPASAAELAEFSGDVAGAGRQILLLIEDIVLWARLRTGAQPAVSPHPLRALVQPVVRLYRPLALRRGVELAIDVDESAVASTDLVLGQTVVRNIVGNALKFAQRRVAIAACAGNGRVGLVIRDDGPGLPPAVLARLRGAGPAEGSSGEGGGMGLRLCQEISLTLGATLEATVQPTGGTEIRVLFPNSSPDPSKETQG